ncbi:uncharacterized protein LOC127122054 [Lathyrus oleraceus]|uniref:uncharacterized protein LOC127122054 n=1 Tax=Pisum sativum TaxID=3888 RepID=UPI0021D3CA11|nr:uncharacterized protein LOC127122054 [Pisum sativum]
MVNRNQNVDDIIRQVRHDDVAADNNLTAIVERIMVRNGVNFGLRRPNYTSPLAEYVLQTDAPLRTKIPKFTKFIGDTTESIVEHMARYIFEAGDMSNNESLQMKFFPSSLTKNAFTWFTTLPQNSIHSWNQLERMVHEQFYMGKTKISLKELASVKQKFIEPTDDYLNRFRLLKVRCFTQVPEHELVEMATGGLDYSIRKKLDTQYLRDMAQLANKVRQVECLKEKKARTKKGKRVAYVDFRKDHEDSGHEVQDFDYTEFDLAELTQGPSYVCKVLAPSNGKNPVEPEKNDRDLVQHAIQEGRLKFGDKPWSQMIIDSDPLQIAEAHYTEPEEVNFIEVANDFCMTEVTEDFIHRPVMVKVHEYSEQESLDDLALRGTEEIKKENIEPSDVEDAGNSKLVMIT